MKKNSFLFLAFCFILASCGNSYQYNVFVKNDTGETIKVKFKTLNDQKGLVEDTIELAAGDAKQIISSKSIDMGDEEVTGVQASHCSYVAEYVDAYIREDIQSQTKWCDENIQFIHEDIQQGSFTITYTKKDFNL